MHVRLCLFVIIFILGPWIATGQVQSVGGAAPPDRWVWLRARWLRRSGVIEHSADGVTYKHLWTFDHGGTLNNPITELLVGKVPFNGDPKDYIDPGPVGESDLDFVRVYGR